MPAKKAVAIVGSHPVTRALAPYDKKHIDIWAFNEAGSQGWLKRWDVLFQLHLPPIWKNPKNLNDPGHYEWLQQEYDETKIIYMQDQYPDVPNSVKYPLDEICDALLPALKRRKGKRGYDLVDYFTSSVPYAIALAIYQGYEQIQIYGVEMMTQTEYNGQRAGVMFWLGVALGRGIEVVVQESSTLFKGLRYGYEGDIVLHRQFFETMSVHISRSGQAAQKQVSDTGAALDLIAKKVQEAPSDEEAQKYQEDYIKAKAAYEMALRQLGMAEGAMQLNQACLREIDNAIRAVGGEKALDAMMPEAIKQPAAVDGA